jgi:hypothetical protein
MRRSKYGYLLLALLVITGLAGTITSTTVSGKERKFAVSNLRDTKNDVLKAVQDLSEKQLKFKSATSKCSIKESVFQAALSERTLWDLLQETLKQPANPEKRPEIRLTDAQLMEAACDNPIGIESQQLGEHNKSPFKSVNEALETLKSERADHIKYIKNTTEDLRNHVVKTGLGWVDCYQLCLLIAANSEFAIHQIEKIKSSSNFPSR